VPGGLEKYGTGTVGAGSLHDGDFLGRVSRWIIAIDWHQAIDAREATTFANSEQPVRLGTQTVFFVQSHRRHQPHFGARRAPRGAGRAIISAASFSRERSLL
jgi:hypothetical protein